MSVKQKIFLTGGSGTLGSELVKINPQIIAPLREECNILLLEDLEKSLDVVQPDIFVHAAAFTNVVEAEKDSAECVDVNVLGTINVIRACSQRDLKLVFISTDYVFDGEKGNYDVDASINPLSKYAKTKGAAELIVRTYPKHLVIRTSFFGHKFPYKKALLDQWTIAPKILKKILSDKMGIVHVGSSRRSMYEIAKTRNSLVEGITMKDIGFPIPRDVSLKVSE